MCIPVQEWFVSMLRWLDISNVSVFCCLGKIVTDFSATWIIPSVQDLIETCKYKALNGFI